MNTKRVKISEVKMNPSNPRTIKDEKFAKLLKSIKEFPEMLEMRPIVVNQDMIVLGGNMRLKACKEAGLKEIPIIIAEIPEEKQKEFIIKDNIGYGEWQWDMLANEWNVEDLEEWGLDIIGFDLNQENLDTEFDLEDGDKPPFQQMTFTLADEQVEAISAALDRMKKTEEFKYVETFANENQNGNALYLLAMSWVEQRK
jgi:ParB-like chromosome segregation protein Spo0J